MIVDQAIAYPPPIVAEIRSERSRCRVSFRWTDNEDGDPVKVKCGSRERRIVIAIHEPSIIRLSRCHVLVQTNEIHFSQLMSVDNCKGALGVSEIGQHWVNRIRRHYRIQAYPLEAVLFDGTRKRPGCYEVSVTFDRFPKRSSKPLYGRSSSFCVPIRR